jgi:capsule polysaccharide modification protein KpsS
VNEVPNARKLSQAEMEDLDQRLKFDAEGLHLFVRLMTQIMTEAISKEDEAYMIEQGLVRPQFLQLQKDISALTTKLDEDITEDAAQEIKEKLAELESFAGIQSSASMAQTAKALESIKMYL